MNETMLPMRTKSTRNHIKDTFLVMLKKKPFLKIRITALCQKAGITRATFYAHYLDIYDLVDDIMNDALIFLDSITDRTCHESFEDLSGKMTLLCSRLIMTGCRLVIASSIFPNIIPS